jgi:hypothetical protein
VSGAAKILLTKTVEITGAEWDGQSLQTWGQIEFRPLQENLMLSWMEKFIPWQRAY